MRRNRPREARNGWRNLIVTTAGIVALAALTAGLITTPRLRAQGLSGLSPADSRWTIKFDNEGDGPYKNTECHPLQYFLTRNRPQFSLVPLTLKPGNISVSAQRLGAINGFEIYDLIYSDSLNAKLIVVERKPGGFLRDIPEHTRPG